METVTVGYRGEFLTACKEADGWRAWIDGGQQSTILFGTAAGALDEARIIIDARLRALRLLRKAHVRA